jgi:hypothetical protein
MATIMSLRRSACYFGTLQCAAPPAAWGGHGGHRPCCCCSALSAGLPHRVLPLCHCCMARALVKAAILLL